MQAADEFTNPYRPHLLRIAAVREETPDVRTLSLHFSRQSDASSFEGWQPGQFGEFTVFGAGESVFAISNAPWRANGGSDVPVLECTFRDVGKVTHALRALSVGDQVGFRGPYGNYFPLDDWGGKNLIFVGGGMGMAALRSLLLAVLAHVAEFGDVLVLNGARSVADMVYKDQMNDWDTQEGVRVVRTVDPGGETPEWDGEVGLIPSVLEKLAPSPDHSIVIACGPPIMLHFLFISLEKMGFDPGQVVTTLENKMKCGIGICGRCNVGHFYVCRDGPVLTWEALNALPKDY